MPASGKTYLGRKLAEKYRKRWVDLDTADYDEALRNGGTEKNFLELEEAVLLQADGNNAVFGCGGSSVYSVKGMNHLKSISEIIYLKLPYEIIKERLGNQYQQRGIVGSTEFTLRELYDKRIKLYEEFADFTVASDKNSTDKQFAALCELFVLVNSSPDTF